VSYFIFPPHKVANQLKIFIPVGTAIIIVAAVKYALLSTSKPTVYMWWAQTKKPNTPIEIIAHIIPILPKIGLPLSLGITSLIIPNPGSISI